MKILYIFALLVVGINFSNAQFCSTGSLNNQGSLTVTGTAQTTPVINANGTRLYYTFDVEPGCIYTFETCGLTTIDTYIRIYGGTTPASSPLLFQNDDACGTQSRVSFQVTAAATYSILITRTICSGPFCIFGLTTCNTLNNNNISLRYVKDCTHTNQECFGSTQICNDISFTGNSAGFGQWQELNSSNRGCLVGNEHQSSWYYFIPTVNGTISMTIQTAVDYDFAIWQGTNCANLGPPIRCSFAGSNGTTGLGNGATDVTEDDFGNRWVAPLNVTAGVFYIMVIDNFTADATPFTIDFTFSSSNLLNCNPTPLPINLLEFIGEYESGVNKLKWQTASEDNNSHFTIERSTDLIEWEFVDVIQADYSNELYKSYEYFDSRFETNAVNYYRLIQTDFDGTKTVFENQIISIDNSTSKKIISVYNMLGQEIPRDTPGFKLVLYSDGTTEKIMGAIKD
jgi:hypothetical protein